MLQQVRSNSRSSSTTKSPSTKSVDSYADTMLPILVVAGYKPVKNLTSAVGVKLAESIVNRGKFTVAEHKLLNDWTKSKSDYLAERGRKLTRGFNPMIGAAKPEQAAAGKPRTTKPVVESEEDRLVRLISVAVAAAIKAAK